MGGKSIRKTCLVFWCAALLWIAHSAAVTSKKEVQNGARKEVPTLETTIHAQVDEAPFKTGTAGADKTGDSLLGKVERQFGSFFGQKSEAKSTAEKNGSKGKSKGSSSAAPSSSPSGLPSPSLSATPSANITMKSRNETVSKSKKMSSSNSTIGRPLETSSTDIVTTKMRVVSFLESISASLEDMRVYLGRFILRPGKTRYKIRSVNETMLIAAVSGRELSRPDDGKKKVAPIRAVFYNKELTVEVEEKALSKGRLNASREAKGAQGTTGEYRFMLKNSEPVVDRIYLEDGNMKEKVGYLMMIPLRKMESKGGANVESASDKGYESGDLVHVVQDGWGTAQEEDEYEFLQAQMSCQKVHGTWGIGRMICTCSSVHENNESRKLLCVSRIVDKVVVIAKDHDEGGIATRLYKGGMGCRSETEGIRASYECLVKLLEGQAGEGSKLHAKHGRSILWDKEVSRAGDGEEKAGKQGVGKVGLNVMTFLVYLMGIGLLGVCVRDLGRQYRGHYSSGEGCDGHLSRLPEHAQALYTRLTLRS